MTKKINAILSKNSNGIEKSSKIHVFVSKVASIIRKADGYVMLDFSRFH